MNKKGFKVNDWCFCEFKLKQIIDIEEGRITSVSDGDFTTVSRDLTNECFPLTKEIKQVSENFVYWYSKINDLNFNSLNYPDIYKDLVERWVRICEKIDDTKFVKDQLTLLEVRCNEIIDSVNEIRDKKVGDFNLIRKSN